MLTLAPRLPTGDRPLWVTYDLPQAHALLAGEDVVFAHHPTTRNLANALRNYRLARRTLAGRDIEQVISTGAAVAVPFIGRARYEGIPCHYIESATRVSGPSLSGRLLERIPGVRLYRQMGYWGGARWRQGPCVFDGYEACPRPAPPLDRVVVSLGTHRFPFDGLVRRVSELLGNEEIVWQLGTTDPPGDLPGRAVTQVPATELRALVRDADVLIGHAGTGLALTALSVGKVPVLVPRRRHRREHADDHQVELARELHRRGLAVVTEVGELNRGHLERAAGLVASWNEPPPLEFSS